MRFFDAFALWSILLVNALIIGGVVFVVYVVFRLIKPRPGSTSQTRRQSGD